MRPELIQFISCLRAEIVGVLDYSNDDMKTVSMDVCYNHSPLSTFHISTTSLTVRPTYMAFAPPYWITHVPHTHPYFYYETYILGYILLPPHSP
jgi:hypothetical protein